jgi:hypothetical protein
MAVAALTRKQCRCSHRLVSLAYIVRIDELNVPLQLVVDYWPAIREYERLGEIEVRVVDFTLDVDHHARACWWSTSESSEKCPRVNARQDECAIEKFVFV